MSSVCGFQHRNRPFVCCFVRLNEVWLSPACFRSRWFGSLAWPGKQSERLSICWRRCLYVHQQTDPEPLSELWYPWFRALCRPQGFTDVMWEKAKGHGAVTDSAERVSSCERGLASSCFLWSQNMSASSRTSNCDVMGMFYRRTSTRMDQYSFIASL